MPDDADDHLPPGTADAVPADDDAAADDAAAAADAAAQPDRADVASLDEAAVRAHPAFAAAVAVEVARYRRRARRRWLVGLGVPSVLAGLLFVAFGVRVALLPNEDDLRPANAIFVLGGPGNRIDRGLELAREGWAPVLVISQPGADDLGFDYLPICQDPPDDVDVRCVDPGDQRTVDEAKMITQQTFSNGWPSIIVVAGREQVTRARIIVRRCYPRDLMVVGADRGRSVPMAVLYEGAATVRALLFRGGGC